MHVLSVLTARWLKSRKFSKRCLIWRRDLLFRYFIYHRIMPHSVKLNRTIRSEEEILILMFFCTNLVRLDVFAIFLWIWFSSAVITIMTKWKTFFYQIDALLKGYILTRKKYLICSLFLRQLIETWFKNMANTSSLTDRGCVMVFEPETCLYVCSIPKP